MSIIKVVITTIVFTLFVSAAFAAEITCAKPRVVDGDTIHCGGKKLRLEGIDAPESRQTCTGASGNYACGEQATVALRARVGSGPIRYTATGTDKYGRTLATVRDGKGENLNEAMVRTGNAVAYRRYSTAYAGAEDAAKARKSGLWAGSFTPPEQWRQENPHPSSPPSAAKPAPAVASSPSATVSRPAPVRRSAAVASSGRGKRCGASYISASKTCHVGTSHRTRSHSYHRTRSHHGSHRRRR
ncbi:micrococcal nuclease [uncultured Gammaproteobacteria bacterium]